jgi:hypothetical protein
VYLNYPIAEKIFSFFKILCDASCETGVPFHNISCVIDTGITLEVNLNKETF